MVRIDVDHLPADPIADEHEYRTADGEGEHDPKCPKKPRPLDAVSHPVVGYELGDVFDDSLKYDRVDDRKGGAEDKNDD